MEQQQNNSDDYIPFGEEWKKEMLTWNKKDLVELLRRKLIELMNIKCHDEIHTSK